MLRGQYDMTNYFFRSLSKQVKEKQEVSNFLSIRLIKGKPKYVIRFATYWYPCKIILRGTI